jgi:NAD(P)H-flavin reductase/ferredoxin
MVVRLACEGRKLELVPGETVLDALLGAGLTVSSSCRAGACQACLVQATRGTPPPSAQQGLKDSLRLQGYFLACQARPEADLEVSLAGSRALEVPARVSSVERLAGDVLRVWLRTERPLEFRAGQYITLSRDDGLARAYSLASRSASALERLELHVRVLSGGRMSGWLAAPEAIGAPVTVRGPAGDCFYVPGNLEQSLILIGTGTGLAPLWGVLQDALAAGHRGPIELWHGARDVQGLYLQRELEQLALAHPQLRYRRCVLEGTAAPELELGRLDERVLERFTSFSAHRVYLCGDPALVQRLKRQIFLRGASLREIHADAFVGSA